VNVLPFCSRVTFCATGVLEAKNFSQFAAISAAAELFGDAGADVPGADVAGADVAGDDELGDELELLQAATVAASARPTAGASMTRRATSWNRMTRS
jgi:hypothetical protein